MSVYGELDPVVGHRTQLAFKDKIEHIAKANTPNIAYPSQHIDIEIPHGSRDHVIVLDTIKILFNLEIKSTDKTSSVVNNVGRALVKRKSSYFIQKRLTRLTTLIFMRRTRTFTYVKKNEKESYFKA